MRVDKGCPYDDAIRVPFIVRYPSRIMSGKVIKRALNTTDFPPTILGLMGFNELGEVHGEDESCILKDTVSVVENGRMVYITDSPLVSGLLSQMGNTSLFCHARISLGYSI